MTMLLSCRQFDVTFSGADIKATNDHSPGRHSVRRCRIICPGLAGRLNLASHEPRSGLPFPKVLQIGASCWFVVARACQTPHRFLDFKGLLNSFAIMCLRRAGLPPSSGFVQSTHSLRGEGSEFKDYCQRRAYRWSRPDIKDPESSNFDIPLVICLLPCSALVT